MMRREIEQKELELVKAPEISDSSRILAVKRAEKLRSEGVLRPSSSPGQRLYALGQHSSRKKKTAIEEQAQKNSSSVKVRPESELMDSCRRLFAEAELRRARLEETRLARLSAEENALKQLSWTNRDFSSIRSQASRDGANFTLISPFCQEHERSHAAAAGAAQETSNISHQSTNDEAAYIGAENENGVPLISVKSRLIVEQMERRSGISSSARLRMPLEKDRVADSAPTENSHSSTQNASSSSSHHSDDAIDSKFEKWREQQLNRHFAKQVKLEEFRKQQEQQMMKSHQTVTVRDFSEDLFYRKQLDKQMKHERILECARAAKEKQELDSLASQKSKAAMGASNASANTRLLQSTAAHEARVAARFKGDA
jgi:hypothetical protein